MHCSVIEGETKSLCCSKWSRTPVQNKTKQHEKRNFINLRRRVTCSCELISKIENLLNYYEFILFLQRKQWILFSPLLPAMKSPPQSSPRWTRGWIHDSSYTFAMKLAIKLFVFKKHFPQFIHSLLIVRSTLFTNINLCWLIISLFYY